MENLQSDAKVRSRYRIIRLNDSWEAPAKFILSARKQYYNCRTDAERRNLLESLALVNRTTPEIVRGMLGV